MARSETPIETRFTQLSKTHCPDLRAELIIDHLELARRLAGRFSRRTHSFDDLYQVASLALVKAVDGFRPELGHQFSSYAIVTILGELKRYFRDQGWSLRTPRRLQELYLGVSPATDELTQQLGRSPTVDEVADHLDVRVNELLEAMEAGQSYCATSLDALDDDGETASDRLGVDDPGYELTENRTAVKSYLAELPERDQRVLKLRFYDGLSQSEIAGEVGISQMQVSRVLHRSLSFLQTAGKQRTAA